MHIRRWMHTRMMRKGVATGLQEGVGQAGGRWLPSGVGVVPGRPRPGANGLLAGDVTDEGVPNSRNPAGMHAPARADGRERRRWRRLCRATGATGWGGRTALACPPGNLLAASPHPPFVMGVVSPGGSTATLFLRGDESHGSWATIPLIWEASPGGCGCHLPLGYGGVRPPKVALLAPLAWGTARRDGG